jgi:hypothetical protein
MIPSRIGTKGITVPLENQQNYWVLTLIGTSAGGCIYIAAVWWLYFREISVQSGGLPIEDLSLLDSVSWSLVWARTFGIAAFTIIAALAVWGTRRGL